MSFLESVQSTFNRGVAAAGRTTDSVKLKGQMSDANKRRQSLAAQLGASLYDLTKDDPSFRQGREALYDVIIAAAEAYGVAFADVEEIEELNILGATYLAMNRAIAALGVGIDLALIDGNRNAGIEYPSRCVVKGDAKCVSIAAASVLAKVTRDRYMRALAEKYPGYGFERHKGYGTEAHYAAIRALGPCPEHRPSFLRSMKP